MTSRQPSRQPGYITRAMAEDRLRARFGPTARIQLVTESGVKGARVTQRVGGQLFVLAQCFSGDPADRGAQAALWALRGCAS